MFVNQNQVNSIIQVAVLYLKTVENKQFSSFVTMPSHSYLFNSYTNTSTCSQCAHTNNHHHSRKRKNQKKTTEGKLSIIYQMNTFNIVI